MGSTDGNWVKQRDRTPLNCRCDNLVVVNRVAF
jgi:hypothetical protein